MAPLRSLVLTAALAAGATLAHAQAGAATDTLLRPRPQFGLVLGANVANLAGGAIEGDARTAMVLGASVLVPLRGAFALQPELHYSQKGTQSSGIGAQATLDLEYLELPLQLRYQVPTAGRLQPFLLGGPTLAYQARCSVRVRGGGSAGCGDGFTDENGAPVALKTLDYGLSLGGGLDFPFGGQTASVGARYVLGLASVTDGATARNRVLQLVFGVRF